MRKPRECESPSGSHENANHRSRGFRLQAEATRILIIDRVASAFRRKREVLLAEGVERVREYIDRHYASPLTVPRLAKRAGLSTFHFIRAFHATTGQTPHQYVRARRIERAKELLITT